MATETQTMSQAHSAPVQKFSRYRSVRQAAKPQIPPPVIQASSSSPQNESVLRSMSRYRKRSSKPDPLGSPPVPPHTVQAKRIPQSHSASLAALTGEPYPEAEDEEPPITPPRKEAASRPRQRSSPMTVTSPRKNAPSRDTPCTRHVPPVEELPQPRQVSWDAVCAARGRAQLAQSSPHPEAGEIMVAEDGRIRRLSAQRGAEREDKVERRGALTAEEWRSQAGIEAEQQERREAEFQRQPQATPDMRRDEQQRVVEERALKKESRDLRRGNSTRQKLGAFSKKNPAESSGPNTIQNPSEQNNPSASRRSRATNTKSTSTSNTLAGNSAPSKDIVPRTWVDAPVSKPPTAQSIDVGPAQWIDAPVTRRTPPNDAPVTLPQYDAPVSAVNAGERHVMVKCNASCITLPVTPTTTPKDLINSASSHMSGTMDPNCSKLVESFTQLGLERPLRNYEHVRDVMNSWDHDAQNTLTIQPVASNGQSDALESGNAPKEQPGDISVYMYHSQRPGTWDKRWITLRPDGQVTIARRQGQPTSNICHLTDFDIYTPTERQQKKRIRPPKKMCFAVKSLQKSNMFLNGANFVHFFATNDPAVAGEWYKAVQGWRSWYLVNVLGEGQKSKRVSTTNGSIRPSTARSQRRASTDATPRQLGSFRPIVDFDHGGLDDNNSGRAPRETKSADVFNARKMSSRDKAPPPSAFLNKLSKDAESGASTTHHHRSPSITNGARPDEMEASTFTPNGLLGRTYTLRQKAQREREINGGRNNSMRSIDPPAGLTRKASTKSVRQMPKPLIDLTPQFQEPPQHARKGKAVIPEPGQQLVDAATGLDLPPTAIMVPSAKAWKRPQTQSPPLENSDRPGRQSMDTGRPLIWAEGGRARSCAAAGEPRLSDEGAFVQGGLLARTSSKRAQGGSGTGHGIRTGDRSAKGKPMIELQMRSRFADGSLLRQVEAHSGADGPLIDRGKGHE